MTPHLDAEISESSVPELSLPPLSKKTIINYSIANIGCGAFFSFNNYVLPLFLKQYTSNAVLLGLMGSSHSVEGAIIQPIVGSLSDHSQTRWGRRRPFMLVFLTLTALILMFTPMLSGLPASIRLGAIVFSIFLFTVMFNIGFDPYQSLMPDITPEPQRGRVMGVWALFGNFAQAAILPLALILSTRFSGNGNLIFRMQFLIVGLLMAATTVITCLTIKEPAKHGVIVPRRKITTEIREALLGIRTLKQAGKAMIVFAVSGAGIGAVVPNLTIFVETITHCTDGQAQMMGFVLLVSTIVAVLPFGWLADKCGPKRVIFISFVLLGIACVNALWIHTLNQVIAVMIIAGIGNGAQAASVYPLLTDLIPGEEVGFYTGFQSTMLSIAQPVTVIFTGLLINHGHGGYRLVFLVCAVCMVAAMILLTRVDEKLAPEEIIHRRIFREQEASAA